MGLAKQLATKGLSTNLCISQLDKIPIIKLAKELSQKNNNDASAIILQLKRFYKISGELDRLLQVLIICL